MVQKKEAVAPAGQRESSSQRINCPFVVNINSPPTAKGVIRFTTVKIDHNHGIWPPCEERRAFMTPIQPNEQYLIMKDAMAGSGRSQIIRVFPKCVVSDR
jgi:hypothetical protein